MTPPMKLEELTVKCINGSPLHSTYVEVCYPDGVMLGYTLQNLDDNWHTEVFESEWILGQSTKTHLNPIDAIVWMFDTLRFHTRGIPIMDRSYPQFKEDPIDTPIPSIVGKNEDFDASSMNTHKVETRKVK